MNTAPSSSASSTVVQDAPRAKTRFYRPRALPTTAAARRRASDASHDCELVRRFNAGEEAAFVEIVTRYREKIFYVAMPLLRNRADAEEVVQDTFIRAYRALGNFRGDSSLESWLHRIATNLSYNRYWHGYRRKRHAMVSIDGPQNNETGAASFGNILASQDPIPSRQVAMNEFSGIVSDCIARLDAPQREILTLRNVMNYAYHDIARMLHTNVGTVKSRIARARENLRVMLAAQCPEFRNVPQAEWLEPQNNAHAGEPLAA